MDGTYLVMDKRNGFKSVVKTLFCFALLPPQNIFFSVLRLTTTVEGLLLFNRNKLFLGEHKVITLKQQFPVYVAVPKQNTE